MRLWALAKDGDGPRRELKIEELWPHKGYLVLKFEGVDSISEAEPLIGWELQVPASERSKLEPGWTYVSDLVGCAVFDGDREIGSVADVQFGAGEAPLLIVKAGSKEYEIPFAEAYLRSTDLQHKKIYMILPEGMLELNVPLTAEEKEQQRNTSKKLSS
jgi:16S rRNA processing protein RimM